MNRENATEENNGGNMPKEVMLTGQNKCENDLKKKKLEKTLNKLVRIYLFIILFKNILSFF